MKPDPYKTTPATLERVIDETPNIKTFRLRPETPIPFLSGQFMELTVPGLGEAPFTPSSSPSVTETLEFTVMSVGCVTERLHALEAGAEVGLRGPLGQPYPLKDFHGREVLIVGGGVGLAPLRALLFALFDEMDKYTKLIVRYGARTPDDIVYREAVSDAWGMAGKIDLGITVDNGNKDWKGHEGVVTTILESDQLTCDPGNGVAVVCGPPIMMKFTTLKLLDLGYPPKSIYLSMEKNMSCGIGKCGHCRLGRFYACKEGPVFTYEQLEPIPKIWD